ncbi:MAG: glycosyltransferase family 39 protein [Alphaproteobacteria bacterium]|nr:glycosyltransferase family 39 protein [Alphaproteobacteria bacterium]
MTAPEPIDPPTRGRPRLAELLVAALLLLAMAAQIGLGADRLSVTTDEYAHLPAGYSYWVTGDFRLNRQHPPLAKLTGALPLVIARGELSTERAWPYFEQAPEHGSTFWQEWFFGETLIHGDNDLPHDGGIAWARRAMIPFGWIAAVAAWLLTRRLFGRRAGLAALSFAAFSPNLLAHAGLVNTDAAMAAFYVATPTALYAWLLRPHPALLVLSGVLLGLGLASKFSNALLLPVAAVMIAVAVWQGRLDLRRAGLAGAALAGLAVVTVWAAYLFQAPPWAWLEGLGLVYDDRADDPIHLLLGHYATGRAWFTYFLVALVLKTPLSTLAAAVLGGVAMRAARHRLDLLARTVLILPPVLLYLAMSARAELMGVRYVLGVVPFLCVLGGAGVAWAWDHAGRWAGVAALLPVATALSALTTWPWHLSYHNALIPSDEAFLHALDDSNNDWYQGWKELVRLQEAGELPALTVDVTEVSSRRLGYPGDWRVRAIGGRPLPGLHALSAFEYTRNRHLLAGQRERYPILFDHPVVGVVAGCIVLVYVDPETRPPREEPDAG